MIGVVLGLAVRVTRNSRRRETSCALRSSASVFSSGVSSGLTRSCSFSAPRAAIFPGSMYDAVDAPVRAPRRCAACPSLDPGRLELAVSPADSAAFRFLMSCSARIAFCSGSSPWGCPRQHQREHRQCGGVLDPVLVAGPEDRTGGRHVSTAPGTHRGLSFDHRQLLHLAHVFA